jgi:regulator of sirC expression with transglutaminase-like and TPR domain
MDVPKAERLQEIYRRLAQAPPAATFAEMRAQLAAIIHDVEDRLTDIPHDPASWRTDGRIYPVQDDNLFAVADHPRVKLLRARKNRVYIGDNGSVEIHHASGTVAIRKAGANGLYVWELD